MNSNILPYDLSTLLMIKSINFLSKVICLSDKFLSIKANINSSSGLSIFAKRQFFVLDLRSFNLNLISPIGIKINYPLFIIRPQVHPQSKTQ